MAFSSGKKQTTSTIVANPNAYQGTNYHQDAITAAQNGDWDAVNRALGARDAKVLATGKNYGTTSDQIYQQLWNQYGAPSAVESGDASAYIKQMYANQTAAELSSLKSAYEQNIAQVDANVPKINAQYQAARNETAAQSEIDKRNFAEYAAANALNSGTGGQAELARQVSLTGNLAGISEQEKNALAENELMKQQLTIAYNNAIAEANAKGDAALAQSLYNEYVRQIEMNYQQQAADREYATNLAYAMLQAGIVPDAATLTAAGISVTEANSLANYYRGLQSQQAANSAPPRSPSPKGDDPIIEDELPVTGIYGYDTLASGGGDESVVAQAKNFVEKNPSVTWDSRTLDNYLNEYNFTPAEKDLFREYVKTYGATSNRR